MKKLPVWCLGGDNTTRISVGYDVEFVANIKCHRIEGERDTGTSMESVVWAITNVEKDIECSLPIGNANIPDLESILSVARRERTARFRKPQRVSAITWETFRVYISWGIAQWPMFKLSLQERRVRFGRLGEVDRCCGKK